MTTAATVPGVLSPFPGLRPFEAHEWRIYFGRDKQTDELIRRLSRTRFLGVVGTSGSGKSSLVRAGLIPALKRGLMSQAASGWRMAVMKPGAGPFKELDLALAKPIALGQGIRIETLRRSSLGLVEAVRQAALGSMEQLLLVVDQFEEIFRCKRDTKDSDETDEFVRLLLATSSQVEIPIHVVLTMRSDFLGECSQFRDLPEALNNGQYLVPRLTRDQLKEAIEGPVFWANADVTPQLVQRLLNDTGDDPDQLPILQHTLLQTWREWEQKGTGPLEIHHYEATGMMADALNRHAKSIYQKLDDRLKPFAKRMFQRLCEKTDDGKEIRRPTRVTELADVAGATEKDIIDIVESFRAPGATFLTPPQERALSGDSEIDLSHESLIRQWALLQDWVKEEAEAAKIYRRLSEAAELRTQGQARLWGGPDLSIALRAQNENGWNAAWARRYPGIYEVTERFLRSSVAVRWTWRAVAGLLVLAVGLSALLFWRVSEAAKTEAARAERQKQIAEQQKAHAEKLRDHVTELGERRLVLVITGIEGSSFTYLNRNTNRAGLSFGLIGWAQKPGRLNEILRAFQAEQPQLFVQIFGDGDAALAQGLINYTAKPRGGTDDQGRATDPHFNLIEEPWISRFERAATNLTLQSVQLSMALKAFKISMRRIQAYAPQIRSERGIAFMLDVANQHGDGGVQSIFNKVKKPGLSEADLLLAVEQESVARVRNQFGDGPEVKMTQNRREIFRLTPQLSDTALRPD